MSNKMLARTNRRTVAFVGAGAIASILIAAQAVHIQHATEIETRSNSFWGALAIAASDREAFSSLEEMAASADSVLVGTISRVEAGRTFGDHPAGHPDPEAGLVHYLKVTLVVDELVGGTRPPDGFAVEFILPNKDAIDELSGNLPLERAVFFLRSKSAEAHSLGLPAKIIDRERLYYRLVNTEAMLRDLDGRALGFGVESPFLLDLEGESFQSVLDRARAER